jgi:hypothetical protein
MPSVIIHSQAYRTPSIHILHPPPSVNIHPQRQDGCYAQVATEIVLASVHMGSSISATNFHHLQVQVNSLMTQPAFANCALFYPPKHDMQI